jgi:hypothetical protein
MNAKTVARRVVALLLGIASVLLGFLLLGAVALFSAIISFTEFTRHSGQSWRGFVFVVTRPDQLGIVLAWIGLAALLGGVGLWLVRDERRAGRAVSLGASAARFCLGGLAGSALDALLIASFLAYRWLS